MHTAHQSRRSPHRGLLKMWGAAAVLGLTLGSTPAWAQADAFPTKPIKLIVPFSAGGSTDVVARVLADGMRTTLGQPVVVDNRGGAGGLMGTEAVAQALPDGYTVGMATVSTMTINPSVYMRAQELGTKLTPLAHLVTMPSVYTVHPKMGVSNFQEFLAKLKAGPGEYSGAVPGLGTLGHLLLESFNETLKTQVQIVPYRGSGPALTDAVAGVVQVMPDQLPSILPHIKSGRLIPMAIAAETRSSELPNVPTFKELGYANLNELGLSWFGMVVPLNTPPQIVKKLQEAAVKAAHLPEVQKQLKALGAAPSNLDQGKFPALIAAETQRNKALLDKAGVKPE